MSLLESIAKLKDAFHSEELGTLDEKSLLEKKNEYLGRKGKLSGLFSLMGKVLPADRSKVGKELNQLKGQLESVFEELSAKVKTGRAHKKIDSTLPHDNFLQGSLHPLTTVLYDIQDIFAQLGFSIAYSTEVDTEFFNFDALNIAANHPARDMQDTFFLREGVVLRTHTSPTQIHHMMENTPPIRIIAPGRVFRNEDVSSRSNCFFHQVEGLYVDRNVNMADLKSTLNFFIQEFYGEKLKTRFRPSYFPFTEPSAEMDVQCNICGGKGCSVCKHTGWLEVLGCGMVDPEVFKSVEYNTEHWRGFAFGFGLERMTMLRYGIEDIRLFFNGDVRFLRQFV